MTVMQGSPTKLVSGNSVTNEKIPNLTMAPWTRVMYGSQNLAKVYDFASKSVRGATF